MQNQRKIIYKINTPQRILGFRYVNLNLNESNNDKHFSELSNYAIENNKK